MLILTRRVDEAIIVGDKITITVLGTKCQPVRLGVNVPKEVGVHREEIQQKYRAKSESKS